MKKITTILFVLIVSILLPSTIFASEKNTIDPDAAVREILDLRVNSNMELYANRVIDERYETDEEKMKAYVDGSLNGDPLLGYEIIEKKAISSSKVLYTVKMEYKSGYVYEHKVNLEKSKGDWHIKILDKYLEKNTDFKMVKRSNDVTKLIEKEKAEKEQIYGVQTDEYEVGMMSSGVLVKSFYGTFKNELYTSNFYVPGPSLILGINEQKLEGGTSMLYRLYKDTLDGWINAAQKRVYNSVTTSQGYTTSFTADVSGRTKVFLRIDGHGYTRGGIYN
ncbi:hypothetical protein [Bacillus sp. AK031]